MKLVAFKIDIPYNPITEVPLEIGEGSFHGIAHTAFFAVGFLLFFAQRAVSSALVQHSAIDPVFAALALQVVLGICLVCKDRAFITTNQLVHFLAIMHTGGGKRAFSDHVGTLVYAYMPFVTVIVLFALLGVRSIFIVLGLVTSILAP